MPSCALTMSIYYGVLNSECIEPRTYTVWVGPDEIHVEAKKIVYVNDRSSKAIHSLINSLEVVTHGARLLRRLRQCRRVAPAGDLSAPRDLFGP